MASHHLAFDLGAESGRALMGRLDRGRLTLTEVRRFANTPLQAGGSLRWNVRALWDEMRAALADSVGAQVASLGVDAWGCDYALLDARGDLVEPPYHYRDHRTDDVMASVTARVPRAQIYRTTGVQFLPFNTIFQLVAACTSTPDVVARASTFVTIPDLLNYWLTGRVACEYTNATTTQAIDARARTWAAPLLRDLGIPTRLFGPIVEAGAELGPLMRDVPGPPGVRVIAPACHDTGSAVAAVRASGDTAFLSSGTWSLLGVELPAPVIADRGRELNFTNEGGVLGSTRLLKNIAGLWLLQACRREWAAAGDAWSYDDLAAAATRDARRFRSLVDPDDPSFLNPASMPDAIAAYCRRTGQPAPDGAPGFTRAILESLALKYRLVLAWLEEVSGASFTTIRVIGGGCRNRLLNQLTADATGRAVVAGPVEATALGNLAMQWLATGHVASLDAAREIVDHSFPTERFVPRDTDQWDAPYRRLCDYMELACA